MGFQTVILYPNDEDLKFDMLYYMTKHMPMVQDKFGQYGLKSYEITKFENNEDGTKPSFVLQVVMIWEGPESMKKAMSSPEVGSVFGDLANFCNKQPVAMSGYTI